jgi:phosphoglycolate phosphatase-like HAD superfamily hydrolase
VPVEYLKNAKSIFWDFDGVIKDSVEVKSDAFEKLFLPFGEKVAKKVRIHHEANSGISRFDKIPIYLKLADQELSKQLVNKYVDKFSELVRQKVIESDWVEGVLEYLQNYHNKQKFFIVTATPQQEIKEILIKLQIADYFEQVIGSPVKKYDAISILLKKYKINPKNSVMIGDSSVDYEAANFNKIPFILLRTSLNKGLQKKLHCLMIKGFGFK